MTFSGIRAVLLILILFALVYGVTKLHMPGWFVAVGIVAAGIALKGWEKRSSS